MSLRLALLLMLSATPLLAKDLDYRVLDPDLKVVRFDTAGRIFVGGCKTRFVYDVDETGTGDKLEVLLPDTKRISINNADIEARKLTDILAMPPGIVKTSEGLQDVLADLLSNSTDSEK